MSVSASDSKQAKQLAVSVAILEVIEKDGLLGVTHSKVARKSKVSRAWIYEYIGKEKPALIEFAADVLGNYFARTQITTLPQTREELEARLTEGIDFLFDSIETNPVIIQLYFRFRGQPNALGQVVDKYEKLWLESAVKTLTDVMGMPNEQALILAELIMTLRLGVAHRFATAKDPAASRERAKKAFQFIHDLLSGAL